ncbi:PLP-dependent aspartate aminotransferase family protein [Staphylococcus massiliensis]|uniref:trans-sulfuration enzyme family protein n=1 Tax=Staphylococcus massiliensis TaxID=555791 RepID=UPI001EDEC34B|nr:PLP-dependent aspartate aminotransferase family protein [Staphylococcus massiliensis]MCG3401334.1 PLP-dependent aspartate aminotransferase family protein [Staphylococcus massiliensis]
MKKNTKLLHDYPVLDERTGASSIPKYQASTFHQGKLYNEAQSYSYTRFGNPTVKALESAYQSLEQSRYALAYSSGMAAISNVLMLLSSGDHVILPKEVYGGTCEFVTKILPQYNIVASFIPLCDIELLQRTIKPNTKMIFIETPSNPLLKICDIREIVAVAKQHDIVTVADNTFMTALGQQPLQLGVDIVVESVTKFINGHSDVVGGLVATNHDHFHEKLHLFQKNFGGIMSIEDAWLILRGIKTLGVRMDKSIENAMQLASYLEAHPKVNTVYYPGLKSHKHHDIHDTQAENGGAVLSFELKDGTKINSFTEALTFPIIAVSLGGVETIISHPATMSHACVPLEERLNQGITDGLLRVSCGIEDASDLIEDFENALATI